MSTDSAQTTTNLRWFEHDATFHRLLVGRIELAQICRGQAVGDWFYTLRFTTSDERTSYSCKTRVEAETVCETHARKVLS